MLYPHKTKDPGEALDYKFDWGSAGSREAPYLEPGETIQVETVTVPAGLVKESEAIADTGRSVIVWLSGGTAGTTYTITCRIVTNVGRTGIRSMSISVQNR